MKNWTDIKWEVMEDLEDNPLWDDNDIIYNQDELVNYYFGKYIESVKKSLQDTIKCAVEEVEQVLREEEE